MATGKIYLETCGADADFAASAYAHRYHEAASRYQVSAHGPGTFQQAGAEMGRIQQTALGIRGVLIRGLVIGLHAKIQCLGSQNGMQLARESVHAGAVVIEYPVGDIAGLLNLGQENATAYGVDASGWQVENVAGPHLMAGQHIADGGIGHSTVILALSDGPAEARVYEAARLGIYHIPHLGFSGLVVFGAGHGIVGMHLDAQVAARVDKLGQQRQLSLMLLCNIRAQYFGLMLLHHVGKVAPPEWSVGYYGGAVGDYANLPRFADGPLLAGHPLESEEPVSAPYKWMEVGLEEERIKFHF